jgi:hypothetical protein
MVVEACRALQAEYLVLQLGHYETIPQFQKILRRMLHVHSGKKRTPDISDQSPLVEAPDREYQPTFRTRLRSSLRIAGAFALTAIGQQQRVFDSASVAASLDCLLSSLRKVPLRQVFLLGPLSCPDSLTRALRRRAEPIFANAARKHGCVYVDAFGMLESFGSGRAFWANFSDLHHLSRLGHQRVGVLLGQSLWRAAVQVDLRQPAPSWEPSGLVPLPYASYAGFGRGSS